MLYRGGENTRKVRLSHHALERVIERFPEAAEFKQKYPTLFLSALVRCAGTAKDSAYESYVVDSGFLEGRLNVPGKTEPVVMYFMYTKRKNAYEIRTILTADQVLESGGRRRSNEV